MPPVHPHELKNAGIATREDAWDADTPLGRVRMVNVVGTIPGRRADRIALATHYDTKLFREFRFVGASDAASSTAAVLELGRVLKSRQNDYTIELLFFDGEEAVIDWYRDTTTRTAAVTTLTPPASREPSPASRRWCCST